jgi:peptidoglycan/LPS O-acetylase OafA/YrhL
MTANIEQDELKNRLELIEQMMAEGRRSTEKWGWSFVLWGVAYYVAAAWATLGHSDYAWPVTMIATGAISGIFFSRTKHGQPPTTLGRALGAIWSGMGISLFVVLIALGLGGHYDAHVYMAIIGAMLAVANGASGLILKWKMQLACAIVWLGAGVAGCFGTDTQVSIVFLTATFFCQIVFGAYVMISEARRRGQHGAVHA